MGHSTSSVILFHSWRIYSFIASVTPNILGLSTNPGLQNRPYALVYRDYIQRVPRQFCRCNETLKMTFAHSWAFFGLWDGGNPAGSSIPHCQNAAGSIEVPRRRGCRIDKLSCQFWPLFHKNRGHLAAHKHSAPHHDRLQILAVFHDVRGVGRLCEPASFDLAVICLFKVNSFSPVNTIRSHCWSVARRMS